MNMGIDKVSYLYPWAITEAAMRIQIKRLRRLQTPGRGAAFIHGHTHLSYLAVVPHGQEIDRLQLLPIRYGMPQHPAWLGEIAFINPGSVGQPLNGDRMVHAAYGILDTEHDTFEFRRVPYDCTPVCEKMVAFNYPEYFIYLLAGNSPHNPISSRSKPWLEWRKIYAERPWGWEPIR